MLLIDQFFFFNIYNNIFSGYEHKVNFIQSIITPRGYVVTPNDKGDKPIIDANGNVKVPDGSNVVLPNGKVITPENGSTVGTDGTIKNPDGSVTNPDGSVTIPEVLIPYMGGLEKIEK